MRFGQSASILYLDLLSKARRKLLSANVARRYPAIAVTARLPTALTRRRLKPAIRVA
jgi:hypothetical protein